MPNDKRYLDYEGLNIFYEGLKGYFGEDNLDDQTARVGYAKKAGKLATPVSIEFAYGDLALGVLEDFDGSQPMSVNLDLSDFALKEDIAAAITFKGVKNYKNQLDNEQGKAGDIWIVKYKGTSGDTPWGAEFICTSSYVPAHGEPEDPDYEPEVPAVWEEFGNTAILDGYVTTDAFNAYKAEVAEDFQDVQDALAAEAQAREAGDIEVYNAIKSIEDYRIRKMFNGSTANTKEALVTDIANASDGEVITLTADVTVDQLIAVDPGKNVTVEIPKGKTLTVENERLFSVGVNNGTRSTLELVGDGKIEMAPSATNDEPLIFVRGGNSLVIDGPTLINRNPENSSLIQTNGNQSNVNILIKSGTFEGSLYLPAGGTTTIEGGDFYYGTQVLYCKSGTLNISGGNFNVTSVPDSTDGHWGHWNNGNVDMGGTIIVEACNYGGRGNPVVNITGGVFNAAEPSTDNYKNYPILVIPYNGNDAVMDGTTVPYQKANPISAHVTIDGKTAPSDGWVYFNDENTITVDPNA